MATEYELNSDYFSVVSSISCLAG